MKIIQTPGGGLSQEEANASYEPIGSAEAVFDQVQNTRFLAFIGDSITAQADSFSGEYLRMDASGYAHWVGFYLMGRTRILTRRKRSALANFGVSGAKINDIRGTTAGDFAARSLAAVRGGNTQLSALLHRAKDRNPIVVDLSGANDVIDTFTYTTAQVASKRKALWDEMILAGIPAKNIVAIAILPNGDATKTAFADAVNAINQADAAALGMTWVPYPSAFKSAGAPVAGYYRDLIHPNKAGACLLGKAVADAISPLIPDTAFVLPHTSDGPWLTPNPLMTGSNATSGSGWSGNLATNWTVLGFSTTTGTTTVLSKFTDTEGEWQRLVVTGTNRENGVILSNAFSNVILAGWKFRIVARVRGTGFHNVNIKFLQGTTADGGINHPGADLFSQNPLNLPAFDGIFVSPVMFAGAGERMNELWIAPQGQGTLDIRQIGLIRCDDEVEPVIAFPQDMHTFVGFTTNGTIPDYPSTIECDASITPISLNLPALSGRVGRTYSIIKTDSSANAVTINRAGSDLINGAATFTLPTQWSKATIRATPTRWVVF